MGKLTLFVLVLAAAACDSNAVDVPDAAVAVPQCSWPAQYDRPDAAVDQACVAGSYLVDCSDSGGGETCLSATKACAGYAATSCVSQCAETEYGIECASGTFPAGCRATAAVPSGIALGCCPCS